MLAGPGLAPGPGIIISSHSSAQLSSPLTDKCLALTVLSGQQGPQGDTQWPVMGPDHWDSRGQLPVSWHHDNTENMNIELYDQAHT